MDVSKPVADRESDRPTVLPSALPVQTRPSSADDTYTFAIVFIAAVGVTVLLNFLGP